MAVLRALTKVKKRRGKRRLAISYPSHLDFFSSGSAFPNPVSAEHRQGIREKLWNKYIQKFGKKTLEQFQLYLEISREFLSGNWQYWSNLRAIQAPSLFRFGHFVFKVIFRCTCMRFTEPPYRWQQKDQPCTTNRKQQLDSLQINCLDNT